MKLAFPNPSEPVFSWSQELADAGVRASHESPRKRMLIPIHRHQDDLVQRMVNILQPGTYIQPHQHPREWATETILVMQGELGFVVFESSGEVRSHHRLAVGEMIDIEERLWHGVLALAPDTMILEIKRGPYDDSDKVFAEWAPTESEEEAAAYRESLELLFSS